MRDGRFGAYVNWGKVNATIPKSTAPDAITLDQALELLAEREGKPTARPRPAGAKPPAKAKAPAKKPASAKKAPAKAAPAKTKTAAKGKSSAR